MTLRRYRDVTGMRTAEPSAASLEDRIAAAWERAHPFGKQPLLRGVARFHSIEEANTARRAATIARMRRLKDERRKG